MVQQLLGILVLQSVSHPLTWYGFDFIMMCPSYHLTVVSCLWMWSTIFGEFQHPPVNGCLTASCNFGALTGGDEHMGKTVSCFGGRTLLSSVQFSRSVVSDSLRSHESQHTRPPLSIINSRSSLKLTSIGSVMPSSHLILGRPLLLLPPIPPSI